MRIKTNHVKQSGLTLVEIMVAILISLLLLAGVITIFSSNKKAYAVQEALARIQEDSRFAVEFISNDIRMAGYPRVANINTTNLPFIGQAVTGCNRSTTACADGNAGDTITISYQSTTDCLGNNTPVAANGNTINTFYIQNNTLTCRGNGSVVPQPLVDGVEDMRILYGEDVDGDDTANRFLTADAPELNMNRVVSIRTELTLITNDNIAQDASAADQRIRRTFTSTTLLRNRIS